MLIERYDPDVFTPPCEPGAERFSAIARLTVDISEVLPYLNATLRGAVYHRAAGALTWKKGGHNVAFHAYEIATSNAGPAQRVYELTDLGRDYLHTWVVDIRKTRQRLDDFLAEYQNRFPEGRS